MNSNSLKDRIVKTAGLIRNLLAVIGFCSLIAGGYGAYIVAKSYDLPPRLLALKALEKYGLEKTSLGDLVKPDPVKPAGLILPDLNNLEWKGHGARFDRELTPVVYDPNGRPIPSAWKNLGFAAQPPLEPKRKRVVSTSAELISAIRNAEAGDEIILQPGIYSIESRRIEVTGSGTPEKPILVRSEEFGRVILEMNTQEGFWINGAYWTFENLDIKGTAKNDDYGEHAFHVVGGGKGFVLRNSRIREFNSMIKGNGHKNKEGEVVFPDGVLVENNSFFNSKIRETSHPVAFIDVVGADAWTIRGNLIADFVKGQGDRISYAAFLKGNGSDGIFENNLVIGEYQTTGGFRVGLSLGGGGSGAKFCRGESNAIEFTGGIIRNNIIMYCFDVGLYLNKAKDTKVFNNTFYKTMGIDVRFSASSAVIQNNLLTGRIKERDGGTSLGKNNLVADPDDFLAWFERPEVGDFRLRTGNAFVDKGIKTGLVYDDFYGNNRINLPDIGAIEYDRMSSGCCPPVLGNL